MSKIYGDAQAIKNAREAKPGDKTVYINWEAIDELPESFESLITEIRFDPANIKNDFANVGTRQSPSWYPGTSLMYRIAEAIGASGIGESSVSPIMEEVDINPMLRKPLDAEPTFRRMIVGRSVSKQSARMTEDGTLRYSSICTAEYNAWERCTLLWSDEESKTDGYANTHKNQYGALAYSSGKYENTCKYDTAFKRKAHFDNEMKFAHAKAETKAYVKTIRELAGMPTGYSDEDLKKGVLYFVKIRKSREILKAETAARLSAISHGMLPEQQAPQNLLFGMDNEEEPQTPVDITPKQEDPASIGHMIAIFEEYAKSCEDGDQKKGAEASISFLKEHTEDARTFKGGSWFKRSLDLFNALESSIPEQFRIEHPDFA